MECEYRLASISDVDQLVRLRALMQAEVRHFSSDEIGQEYLDRVRNYFLTSIPSKKYFSSVAVFKNHIIGTAGVCLYHKPPNISGGTGLIGYVTNVFVETEFRKKGIGAKMMSELNKLACELKVDKLHLGATSDGLSIYRSVGYVEPHFVNLEIKFPIRNFDES